MLGALQGGPVLKRRNQSVNRGVQQGSGGRTALLPGREVLEVAAPLTWHRCLNHHSSDFLAKRSVHSCDVLPCVLRQHQRRHSHQALLREAMRVFGLTRVRAFVCVRGAGWSRARLLSHLSHLLALPPSLSPRVCRPSLPFASPLRGTSHLCPPSPGSSRAHHRYHFAGAIQRCRALPLVVRLSRVLADQPSLSAPFPLLTQPPPLPLPSVTAGPSWRATRQRRRASRPRWAWTP